MYRIMICDDERIICEQVSRMLRGFPESSQLQGQYTTSASELVAKLRQGEKFDLLILDIELIDLNGAKIGKLLRKGLQDMTTEILYISAHQEYALSLFDTQPINFLLKPISQEKLHENLRLAMRRRERNQKFLDCIIEKVNHRIPLCTIRYFESSNKRVNVYTTSGCYLCYSKLSDIKSHLTMDFIQIHKSFLVNEKYIVRYTKERIWLDDGRELLISRSFREEAARTLINLL